MLYIPHGGGPLPVLGHEGHTDLINFLKGIPARLPEPEAILVISAHWEQYIPTIIAGGYPPLIYDYTGFPQKAYEIVYPVKGAPVLAKKIHSLLNTHAIPSQLDKTWGFDHGVFIPLKLMYPNAHIPCTQLSLTIDLDPSFHIKIGHALASLKDDNILVLGSGFSFHNMTKFGIHTTDKKNIEFDQWLIDVCTSRNLSKKQKEEQLIHWEKAPHARYCHPREDHLLPLHVCLGLSDTPAQVVFNQNILGKRASAFLWQ